MRLILFILFIVSGLCLSGKELKVLMVGNSFSQSVLRTLPQIAKTAGCQLKIANAMISGCTFERHVAEWEKCEKNPLYKPYTTNLKLSEGKLASLQDLLSAEKWDIVTIQQGSSQSPFPASYQYAASLITRIRTFLPEAEIMIQQTWSYRSDSDRLQKWKMSQKEMYDQLTSNYFKLADKNHFRIIPVGWAVELYRQNSGGRYMPISAEEMDKLKYPHVPATQNFDAVGNIFWRFNKQNGTWKLINDPIHLNLRGQYLQGCVWFAVLFQRNAETITFSPRNISAEDAAFIRNCAQKAIESFRRQ